MRKEWGMLRRPDRLLAALACVIALAFAGPRPAVAAADNSCAPRLRAALNVDLHGAPLVTLMINGRLAHLLLDTGAERTMLTETAARRLGLLTSFDHVQTVRGIGGNVMAAR